jgi:hypothetical protein
LKSFAVGLFQKALNILTKERRKAELGFKIKAKSDRNLTREEAE